MLLRDTVESYLNYIDDVKNLSVHSIRAYRQDLLAFCQTVDEEYQILDISSEHLLNYLRLLHAANYSSFTIKRRVACIKTFFLWCGQMKYIFRNPCSDLDLTVRLPHTLPKNLTDYELKRILLAAKNAVENGTSPRRKIASQSNLLALEVMLLTGLRVGELVSIKNSDLIKGERKFRVTGKGLRDRDVFITSNEVQLMLINYIRDKQSLGISHSFLFTTSRDTPASENYIRFHLKQLKESAGISRNITPHMYRHSAATMLLEADVDIRYVQRLLGHQNISTTEKYTHVSTQILEEKVKRANIRGRIV